MKAMIYFLLLSCLGLPLQLSAAVGDVNYISDVLTVPLRSGASTAHRIIHRGLPSGTQLIILATDEESEFTQIRTAGGMEGWVRSQHLVGEPIAKVKLTTAKKRLKNLTNKVNKEREAHSNLKAEVKEIKTENKTLNTQVESLSNELMELKRISADPINEHARNVELTQQNNRLVEQVDELSSKNRHLEDNVQLEWLLYGGTLVLIGLIIGAVIKTRPRQSSYSRYS